MFSLSIVAFREVRETLASLPYLRVKLDGIAGGA
jgi:hypothetical protein